MTFVRVKDYILYLEQEQKDPFIYQKKDKKKVDPNITFDLFKFTWHLKNYQHIWLYNLLALKVDDAKEEQRIINKMTYVMTGLGTNTRRDLRETPPHSMNDLTICQRKYLIVYFYY